MLLPAHQKKKKTNKNKFFNTSKFENFYVQKKLHSQEVHVQCTFT